MSKWTRTCLLDGSIVCIVYREPRVTLESRLADIDHWVLVVSLGDCTRRQEHLILHGSTFKRERGIYSDGMRQKM